MFFSSKIMRNFNHNEMKQDVGLARSDDGARRSWKVTMSSLESITVFSTFFTHQRDFQFSEKTSFTRIVNSKRDHRLQ